MQVVELGTSMQSKDFEQQPELMEQINSNNTQTLKKIIAKHQTRIKQLLKTVSKQKKTNDQLRQQLKQLNQTLNKLITKVSNKSKPEKQDPAKEQVIKKQLQIEMRKNSTLKKQMETIRAKLKVYQSQKLSDLHNEIRSKDKVIEDLHQSLKIHEKIQKKEMNLDIYRKEQQAQKQIKNLSQEITHLRKLIQQQRKMHDQQDRSILFQQKKINQIETRQKSLPKVTQPIDPNLPKQTYNLLQKQVKSLKQQLQTSEKQKKIMQKQNKTDLQIVKAKLKNSQKAVSQLKQQLSKKQKQSILLSQKLKIIQKSNSYDKEPIIQQTNVSWSQLIDCRRELKGASNIKPTMKKFDDTEKLPQDQIYKIRILTFKYFEEHIIQLRITYDILGDSKLQKKQQTVTSFSLSSHYQSAKEATLQLSQYEYITEWELFLGKGIQYIRIRTSKQQILEAGNQRNSLKCKRFTFDIKSFEKPIACYGVIDNRNFGQKEKEVLIALGLVLKRKDVFGGRSKSLVRLQKPSHSALAKLNDKNLDSDK